MSDHSAESTGKCPVMGHTKAGAAGNNHWWPNQLNIKVLHQHSPVSATSACMHTCERLPRLVLIYICKDFSTPPFPCGNTDVRVRVRACTHTRSSRFFTPLNSGSNLPCSWMCLSARLSGGCTS